MHELHPEHIEFETRITGLKFLAGLSEKPSDRMACLSEVLRLRSLQLASEFRSPSPVPGPSIPPYGVTAAPALHREAAGPLL